MERKRSTTPTSDPQQPDIKDAAIMDTDVIDPSATKEVAMTSLDWLTRSRQLSLLNGVLRVHFSNCAISDLEQECSRILRNAVTSGCKETLASLLRHVDDAFLSQRQDDDVGGAGGSGDDAVAGVDVVKYRPRRTRLEKLLGLAVEHGHRDVVQVLLTKGANPNCCYRHKPLLHLSLSLGHHDVALLLAESGADVNMTDSKGETPIFAALSSDSRRVNDVIDDLISRGADVNHCSLTGRRPIHSAALSSNAVALARLAEAGCDVSAADVVLGDTPLHLACSRCCHEAVVTLVRHGARINVLNDQGETPLRRLLQHATRVTKDFHHHARMRLARVLVRLGFRLVPPPSSSQDSELTLPTSSATGALSTATSTSVPNLDESRTRACLSVDNASTSAPQVHSPLPKLSRPTWPSSSSSFSDKTMAREACATSEVKTAELAALGLKKNSCENNTDERRATAGGAGSGGGGGSTAHRPLNGRKGRDKVREAFENLLGEKRGRRVPALQHLCRMEIRRHLPAVGFQTRVQELELSSQVRQYLMFLPRLLDDTL